MKKLFLIPLLLLLPVVTQATQIAPNLTLNPYEGDSNDFGTNIQTVSDISGDGIDDLIVGAPTYNDSEGRIDIFFGKQDQAFSDAPDFTITGGGSGETFGDWVTTFPDVTGDGLPELISQAQYATVLDETLSTNTNTGIIYFFASESIANHSSSSVNALDFATAALVGANADDAIGYNLVTYEDNTITYLMVGAPNLNDNNGSVFLFSRDTIANFFTDATHSAITNQSNIEIVGESADTNFGTKMYAWEEGGYIVLSASAYNENSGRVYFIPTADLGVFTTVSNIENISDLSSANITSTTTNNYFGGEILDVGAASIGGYHYLAIGSSLYNPDTDSSMGQTYIVSSALIETITAAGGSGTAETDATIVFTGSGSADGKFGGRFANANNNYFAISERGYNNSTGAVYLFKNSTLDALANDEDAINQSAPSTADFILYGTNENQNTGFSLDSFDEDIDGDGISELSIGSTGSTSENVAGAVHIVPSTLWIDDAEQTTTTIDNNTLYTYSGNDSGDGLGWKVISDGDYDNNGDVDVLSSALNFDTEAGYVTGYYNLEDGFGAYEHLLTLGQNKGKVVTQDVEERAYDVGSKNSVNFDTDGKMLVTAGDVDSDGNIETITSINGTNRCHTIYIYSGSEKDKQFRACHPARQQTDAYISAGSYSNSSGQAYIAVAFPDGTQGVYLQVYRRQSNGSYKKVHRKRIETNVDFSQGINISSGNLTDANSAQIVLAATSGIPKFFVYKLSSDNKLRKVTEKQIGSQSTSLSLAVDGSTQMLYTNKAGKKKIKAYTWDGTSIVKDTDHSFTAEIEPAGLAAEADIVSVLNKKRKTVRFYYGGDYVTKDSYSNKIWSLDLVNQ